MVSIDTMEMNKHISVSSPIDAVVISHNGHCHFKFLVIAGETQVTANIIDDLINCYT